MTWQKTVPISSTYIINIPEIFQGNWTILEDTAGVQHHTYTSTLSGRHKPGISPVLYADSTGNITGLTTPQSGALAWDTTLGVLKRYTGAAWAQVNLDNLPVVDVYLAGDQTVASAASTTYTVIEFDTETTDVMSSFSTTTHVFTAPTNGYYLIVDQLTAIPTEAGIDIRKAIAHYNASAGLKNAFVNYSYSWSTNTVSIRLPVIVEMIATDYIAIGFYHDNVTSQIIAGGSDYTFLKIYKVS